MTEAERLDRLKSELRAMRGDFEQGRDTGDPRHVAAGLLRLLDLVEWMIEEGEV